MTTEDASTIDESAGTGLSDFLEHHDVEHTPELPDSPVAVGRRLAEARTNCGLTVEAFAEQIGVTVDTAAQWERGEVELRPNQLSTAAGLLGVSPSWLLIGEGVSPSEHAPIDELSELRDAVANAKDALAAAESALDRLDDA